MKASHKKGKRKYSRKYSRPKLLMGQRGKIISKNSKYEGWFGSVLNVTEKSYVMHMENDGKIHSFLHDSVIHIITKKITGSLRNKYTIGSVTVEINIHVQENE